METINSGAVETRVLFPDFIELRGLWEGARAIFPSEQSARWALRNHRARFLDADALVMWRGSMFVHPDRVRDVIQHIARENLRKADPRA